jgi:hypothetical protein
MHRKPLLVLAAVVATASIASTASAAQRYASPTGQLGGCTATNPCGVTQAIVGAKAGDEVILAPGKYPLAQNLFAPGQITIHGVTGQPRPRLVFSGPGQFGLDVMPATTLRHLEVHQEQTAVGAVAIAVDSATLDQVVVKGAANGPTVQMRGDSTMRDSVVIASAPGLSAISAQSGASTMRNVTAIATGTGGPAISAWAAAVAGTVTVDATNVIAYAWITMRHSSWMGEYVSGSKAKVVDAGDNQHSAPAFVDAATGDFRQAAGSPTIDAGLSDAINNGPFDLDGDPRSIGATDIGADEFVPPPPAPATQPPTTPAQPFAGVSLVSSTLIYARRAITVRLRCPAGTVGRCSGRTKLTAKRRRTSSRRISVGRAAFSIAPGSQARVKVRVTRAGRRLIRRVPRVRGRAVNVAGDAAGQSKTIRAAVTVRRRAR